MAEKVSCFEKTDFQSLNTLTIYSNISKMRLFIQITLYRKAKTQMDISKKNHFSVEKAKKVPIWEILESSRFFSSPMLQISSCELKIIAYKKCIYFFFFFKFKISLTKSGLMIIGIIIKIKGVFVWICWVKTKEIISKI